jgi:hypothetical protein
MVSPNKVLEIKPMNMDSSMERKADGRKSYTSPVLVCYGDFSTITLTGGNTNKNDGPGLSSKAGA